MGRPRKEDAEINELERLDTMYWCGVIKAASGLSDSHIEEKLEHADPTGRNFNRWLTGKRAQSHDSIQLMVKKARKVGLLPPRKSLGTHKTAALEGRAMASSNEKATAALVKSMAAIRELHEARRALDQAAQAFQAAARAAEKHRVDIFDTINDTPARDDLEACHTESISKRISEIASWYFFNGDAHGFA